MVVTALEGQAQQSTDGWRMSNILLCLSKEEPEEKEGCW
jgi:hypothetical protein